MKITLLATGKTHDKHMAQLLEHYENRIKRYCPFKIIFTSDMKTTTATLPEIIRLKEYELQKKHLNEADYLVLLDAGGKQLSSENFARFISKKQIENRKHLVFITGGAFGFAKQLTSQAHEAIALSLMTFPHDLVRIIFAEQLYRAFTILNNERYHH